MYRGEYDPRVVNEPQQQIEARSRRRDPRAVSFLPVRVSAVTVSAASECLARTYLSMSYSGFQARRAKMHEAEVRTYASALEVGLSWVKQFDNNLCGG